MSLQEFPVSVIEKLEFYVYLLIDPRMDEVFYIGKGTGNRVFSHANGAISNPEPNERLGRIQSIQRAGMTVGHVILRHGLTEPEALEVEAALIDYVGVDRLTNQVHGFSSDERGKMCVAEIIEKYAAPEAIIIEPAILVTVNQKYQKGMSDAELYEITRGNWVIGVNREKVRYAFAVYNGIIRQVFRVEAWRRVINPEYKKSRWQFTGCVADELQHYVGSSTVRYTKKGAQNPIRYVNIFS